MRKILLIVLIALSLKLLYLIFSNVVVSISVPKKGASLNHKSLTDIFHQNDSFWYEKISREGYPKITDKNAIGFSYNEVCVQSSWAFFPFYPLLNSAIIKLTDCKYVNSALFLSLLFSILSFIGFYKFNLFYLKDEKRSFFNTLLFMALPFNYYFSVFYTEAIFFTCLIFCFIAIHKNREWMLLFLLIPLILLRPNGIILTIPLYLYYLERHSLLIGYKVTFKQLLEKQHLIVLFYFASALIAFLIYGYYQKTMTGEFFAFSIAQRGWYREFMFPVLALFRRGDFATQFNSFYTIAVIIFSIAAWKKFSLSLNVFIWISLILPMCSGSMTSMQRFITLIFPLTIYFGEIIYKTKFKQVILLVSLTLQLFVFYFWLNGDSFSF